jgi:hypothetical protein
MTGSPPASRSANARIAVLVTLLLALAYVRNYCNGAVEQYNGKVETVPGTFIARPSVSAPPSSSPPRRSRTNLCG